MCKYQTKTINFIFNYHLKQILSRSRLWYDFKNFQSLFMFACIIETVSEVYDEYISASLRGCKIHTKE